MKPFFELEIPKDKPWLIVGKGPSFSKFNMDYQRNYYILGLNHVVEHIPCDIGHFIDIDVMENKWNTWQTKCTYIVCPYHPHVDFRASSHTINSSFLETKYLLNNLYDKLYYYDLSTWRYEGCRVGPVIKAKYFSAEAAFRLLHAQGIKTIYSIGIDGGTEYAKEFAHLKPLQNNRKTFDDQFAEINKFIESTSITYKAL